MGWLPRGYFTPGWHGRAGVTRILAEFVSQANLLGVTGHLRFSQWCGSMLAFVLMSWFGHQFVTLGTAFDDARFDSAGAIADFVAGNLQETVFAQCFPDSGLRRHKPL